MGVRGPVPKRTAQRLGHMTKAEKAAVTSVTMSGRVEVPPADPDWHELARSWYESLAVSGQAQFFEPSDWAAARYVAEVMTTNLQAGRFSSQLFAAVWQAMGDLLTTEGERRRVKLEIDRKPPKPEGQGKVARLDDYRNL
jgi:hypothetical protein